MIDKEIVGFHKGALSTLVKERQELIKILEIVEQLIRLHIQSLKKLGIDIGKEFEQSKHAQTKSKT